MNLASLGVPGVRLCSVRITIREFHGNRRALRVGAFPKNPTRRWRYQNKTIVLFFMDSSITDLLEGAIPEPGNDESPKDESHSWVLLFLNAVASIVLRWYKSRRPPGVCSFPVPVISRYGGPDGDTIASYERGQCHGGELFRAEDFKG